MVNLAASAPPTMRVGQRRAGIGIGRGDGRDGRGVLGDVDGGGGAAAVGGDDRGIVVDVGDGDGDGLGVGQGAVGDLHGDVVDIVAAGIGRGSRSSGPRRTTARRWWR